MFKYILVIFLPILAGCALSLESPLSLTENPPASNPPTVNPICSESPVGEFQAGVGSPEDPYVICTTEHWRKLQGDPNFWLSSFKLGQDLDLSSLGSPVSIGIFDSTDLASAVPFGGRLDGDGHKIVGFETEAASVNHASGLFAYTSGAHFSNLSLENFRVKGDARTGGLIGYALNTKIENLSIQGVVEPRTGSVVSTQMAGLVGYYQINDPSELYEIKDIRLDTSLSGNDIVGNLIGRLDISEAGVSLRVTRVSSQSTFDQSSAGNTVGGVIAFAPISRPDVVLVFEDIHHRGDLSLDMGGGSWNGGVFGQLYVSGVSSRLTLNSISYQGNFSSVADFNLGGSNGGIVGNLVLTGVDSIYELKKLSAVGDITVLSNGISNNNRWGGLFGALAVGANLGSSIDLSDSYYRGTMTTQNNNNLISVGGMIGFLQGSTPISISNSYVNLSTSFGGATLIGALAVVGSFASSPSVSFTNVYFAAPANMIGGGSAGEPSGSGGVHLLNSSQIVRQDSFVGFDFASTWAIDEGQSSPTLRPL